MEFYNYGRDLAVKNEHITANLGWIERNNFFFTEDFLLLFVLTQDLSATMESLVTRGGIADMILINNQ